MVLRDGLRSRVRCRALEGVLRRLRAVWGPARHGHWRPQPSRRAETGRGILTILSSNLWHDWPRHRDLPQRLERLAGLIEQERVDVALLQEVARTPGLRADEWLADRLGMACLYWRANGHAEEVGFEEGLAILSRYPMEAPRVRALGSRRTSVVSRLALGSNVLSPHGPLSAYSVHLGLLPLQNASQMESLHRWVSEEADRPAVIGGDFNASERSPQIRKAQHRWLDTFRALHPHADGVTHELHWPWGGQPRRRRLDYVFLRPGGRPWRILESMHLISPEGPHSDHRAVLARLIPAN